ncbi:MAG: hypothetical protein ACOX9A_12590 [Anaerolineae bacterium]|jgi:hypothetical protein
MLPWHERTARDLVALLRDDPDVLALAGYGTMADGAADRWSDLDVLLVVRPRALARYYPSPDWLTPLGRPFAHEVSQDGLKATLRVCLDDFRRLDIVITTDEALSRLDEWPTPPFWQGIRLLFSHSAEVEALLKGPHPPPEFHPMPPHEFEAMADRFWFKGSVVIAKVMRNDLLIGLHLALDMMEDCLVPGMILRDRAAGTTHHRHGGPYSDVAKAIDLPSDPCTAQYAPDIAERAALLVDDLGARWSADYVPRGEIFRRWLNEARAALGDAP